MAGAGGLGGAADSLGTPETRRRGLRTRKARRALKSVVVDTKFSITVETRLETSRQNLIRPEKIMHTKKYVYKRTS